jgi:hypothetical protein
LLVLGTVDDTGLRGGPAGKKTKTAAASSTTTTTGPEATDNVKPTRQSRHRRKNRKQRIREKREREFPDSRSWHGEGFVDPEEEFGLGWGWSEDERLYEKLYGPEEEEEEDEWGPIKFQDDP